MIEARTLTKTYRTGKLEFTALKQVDIRIETGEFVGIMGRSGSGKSTLLYQLSLLDRPTSGSVLIDGAETAGLSESERVGFRLRNLGYIFQDHALLPELTAAENVMLPMLMLGRSRNDALRAASQALGLVGLAEKLRNLPDQMSGGEKQRVSIARAVNHHPKIIFADEPTASLDSETAMRVMQTFIDLHRQGQTIVMVTHEEEFAGYFDKLIRLDDGRIASVNNKK